MWFPIQDGKYRIEPGLRRLGPGDRLFEVTKDFDFQVKLKSSLAKNRSPVYLDPSTSVKQVDQILMPLGHKFVLDTGKQLKLGVRLGMQIQEDLAIIQEQKDANKIIYLHVSFPNGWDPAKKIGGSFSDIHAPVAHFSKMAAAESKIVKAMIDHGPFERFAWGIHTVSDLDRLSKPDCWDTCNPSDVVFRVERQTTLGVPEYRASLFTIQTQICFLRELTSEEKTALASALLSMDEESQRYKGITTRTVDRLCEYLGK